MLLTPTSRVPDRSCRRLHVRAESGAETERPWRVFRNPDIDALSHRAFSDVDEALSAAGLGSGERLENPS
jgi:hypothetical protein